MIMKRILSLLFILYFVPALMAQNNDRTEKQAILKIRNQSNRAIKEHRLADFISSMTEDISITTGGGTQIIGKDSVINYLGLVFEDNKELYFVRESKRVSFNESYDRAWEQGKWTGYNSSASRAADMGGNYAAMWIKVNGEWKIRSELFVALY